MRELEGKLGLAALTSIDCVRAISSQGVNLAGPERQIDYVHAARIEDLLNPQTGTVIARVRTGEAGDFLAVKVRRMADLDRDEFEVGVDNGTTARGILAAIGLPERVVVAKSRWHGSVEQGVTITVDDVDSLGVFVEVELLVAEDDGRRGDDTLEGWLQTLASWIPAQVRRVTRGYDRLLLEAHQVASESIDGPADPVGDDG